MHTQQTTQPRNDAPANTAEASKSPIKVLREGAIAASIWERTGSLGTYYEYTLSRSWKSKDGEKSGYSANFTARNAEQLVKVIEQATRYINERQPRSEHDAA